LQRYNFFLKQQNFFAINLHFFCIFVVSYLLKMLRKLFILLLLSAPLATVAQNCNLIDNLIIRDTINVCRWDTIRFELTNNSPAIVAATDTSLIFQWTSTHEWHGITENPFFVIPTNINIEDIAGTVFVRIEDTVNNCIHYDTIVIEPFPFPEIRSWFSDTVLCFGDTLMLQIEMDSLFHIDSIAWRSTIELGVIDDPTSLRIIFDSTKLVGDGNARFIVDFIGICRRFPGDHMAVAGGPYRIFDTIDIFFAKPLEIHLQSDTIMCWEDGFELIALDANDFDASHFEFRWIYDVDTVGRENTFTVSYEAQGLHAVKVWHEFCFHRKKEVNGDTIDVFDSIYFVMDSVEIRFYDRTWTVSRQQDTAITFNCRGQRITLDFSAVNPNRTTYFWQDDTLNRNPVREFHNSGNFTIVLTDSAGCQSEFTVDVSELFQTPEVAQHMPNIFTPNNDGLNDFFELTNNPQMLQEQLRMFYLRIYNRSGREVFRFEGNPVDIRWDGTSRGSPLPDGTYFWRVNAVDGCGVTHREQGTVTILR